MPDNTPLPYSENPEPHVFTSMDINVNGQNYSGLNQLPPEYQEKVKAALAKMQNNPGLASMISSIGDLAKSTRLNGIGVTQMNSTDKAKLVSLLEQHLAGKDIFSENPGPLNSSTMISGMGAIPSAPVASDPASFENSVRPVTRNMPMPSATYNPMVKGDGLRKAILVGAAVLVVGYLIVKFGYNGQLPF